MRDPRVEEWLDKLQDAVEDAEDLFDQMEYDALKLAESEPNKVKQFFYSFNLTDRKTDMEKLLERLDTCKEEMKFLHLQKHVEKIHSVRPPSMSSIDESEFYGRDDEIKSLKRTLLSDEIGREKICVIPIVGLGGIGKTTLAQAIYNDGEVKKHFEQFKAWVCVSDEDDVLKVPKILYEAITGDTCAVGNFNVLAENIQEMLKEKKFLIILDDVWCEECTFWDTMRGIFNVGAQGSKIIVTTRSGKVAAIVGTTKIYHLNELNEEACLELFVKIVSLNKEFIADSDSERIGKEIVKKCKGLPLAVKALASLLLCTEAKQWDKIAKSDVLDLPCGETDVLPALKLSYDYLPSHLKKCFVYCCLFPKDYLFTKDELVSLWMANDLLEPSSAIPNQTRAEVGYGYFNDLVSRSFFQSLSSRGRFVVHDRGRFVVHDLMVDLANFVSRKRLIHIKKNKSYENENELMKRTRHIGFGHNSPEIFKLISEAICLRTFLPTISFNDQWKDHPQYKIEDLVQSKYLRFLSLRFLYVPELPESIGELSHLRFLDLSYTYVKELPKSFCMLYNLQTLKMDGCDLIEFPEKFYHLINLRYLMIVRCPQLCKLPPLGQLPALETLEIEKCDAIEIVDLEFYGTTSTPFPSLEALKFKHMSNWKEWSMPIINAEAFPKLKSLIIHMKSFKSSKLCKLPSLGQLPALETLEIEKCDAIEIVGEEFYGATCTPFPSLETLKFDGLSQWKKWSVPEINVEAFPKLKSLVINGCKNLRGDLPCLLPSLVELHILQCPMLGSWIPMMPNVSEVRIKNCDKIAGFKSSNFDKRCVPTDLTNLCIISCGTIEFLPPHKYESLQELSIKKCSSSSLEFLQIDSFPNIRKLEMKNCESVVSFSQFHGPINYLSTLEIQECHNFTFSPDSNLHCPTLTKLMLSICSKLRFLPDKLPTLLPCLQQLVICSCPELESLPRFGLPLSLRQLTIVGCDKLIASRKNWNLQALPNLIRFEFRDYKGEDMVSFLEQGFLPASLIFLQICSIACLKTLDDKGFQELTSLKELMISDCPNLERLPVKGLPPSFEGSLPPSFESFFIWYCPLLNAKYEWKEYDVYKKICCIPRPQVPPSP